MGCVVCGWTAANIWMYRIYKSNGDYDEFCTGCYGWYYWEKHMKGDESCDDVDVNSV